MISCYIILYSSVYHSENDFGIHKICGDKKQLEEELEKFYQDCLNEYKDVDFKVESSKSRLGFKIWEKDNFGTNHIVVKYEIRDISLKVA